MNEGCSFISVGENILKRIVLPHRHDRSKYQDNVSAGAADRRPCDATSTRRYSTSARCVHRFPPLLLIPSVSFISGPSGLIFVIDQAIVLADPLNP